MKKILLWVLLAQVCLSTSVIAQSRYRPALQKGSVLAGGNVGFSFGTYKSTYSSPYVDYSYSQKYSSVTMSPHAGVFVANGFSLGLIVDLTSATYKGDEFNQKDKSSQYAIGPAVRFYTPGGFFFHADIAFGKNTYKSSSDWGSSSGEDKLTKYQLGIGYAIFVNDFVALEPSVTYRSSKMTNVDGEAEGKDNLGEFVVGMGFSIYLHKRSDG
jgi:hypothetical protein